MLTTLEDLSPSALVNAIKANLFEYYRYLGRSPQSEFRDDMYFTWLISEIPHPFLNAILRAQLPTDRIDHLIDETLAHFRSRSLPGLSWWLEADSSPGDLAGRLLAHGLAFTEGSPGMAADLGVLNEEVTAPSELKIERVADNVTLQQCVRAFNLGFDLPSSEDAAFDLYAGLGFDLPLQSYVGILDGEPVATAQMFLGAGVAGIYCVSTVSEARRQGIAAALVLEALRQARNLGYRAGILHSTPLGFNVYRRLGFRELCGMPHFTWKNQS